MKTTLAGRFLAVTILAVLLMASFAIAKKEDRAEVLMEATHEAHERLLGDYADQSDQVASCTRRAVLRRPAGLSNGSTIVASLVSEYSEPVLQSLPCSERQTISDITDPGIPSWLYCFLHPRWCKNF